MIAIKTQNITKIYNKNNERITAIDKISYEFDYGKMYVIMGHSGSGKSTLIQCLGTLDKVNSGDIYINGKNVSSMKESELNYLRNNQIGFIFQNYNLNNNMKAYENVMLPMLINKNLIGKNLKKRAESLLSDVGLAKRYKHYPREMSGGEQQRVAIARALANNPQIILADEPTGNLDEENEIIIFASLRKMAEMGKCVIVVSHDSIAKKYADVVIRMEKGRFGD